MIRSISILRAALPALAALLVWSGLAGAQAQTGAPPQTSQRPKASTPAFPRVSVSGSYLAARHAGVSRDAAAASIYYRAALRGDPRNPELLSRAFMAVLQNGEIDEAVRLAERLLQVDKSDRVARLVLGVRAIKQKQYPTARQQLAQSVRGPITDLAATLLSAWTHVGPNESKAAIETIDKLAGPDSYNLLQGPACRPDPRSVGPPARCAQAAGARLQIRRDRAAGRAGLWQPALARSATATRR